MIFKHIIRIIVGILTLLILFCIKEYAQSFMGALIELSLIYVVGYIVCTLYELITEDVAGGNINE